MSLLNGIGALGAGLGAFAGNALKDATAEPERKPLLNSTPSPAVPAESTPAAPPAQQTADGPPPQSTAKPGETLASIHPELTSIAAPGGAKFTVAASVADKFQGLVTDLEKAGYTIDPATSGGYNPRVIAGTNTPSLHAHGLAIDVNWHSNARGENTPSDLPPDLARALAAKHGLTWGGDWHGATRDPMHFEAGAT